VLGKWDEIDGVGIGERKRKNGRGKEKDILYGVGVNSSTLFS
jgi:hypothetical protein